MRKTSILVLFVVLISCPLFAQNADVEALSGIQFNFGNPGARSLGMGGAFLGLADDASAAEANPAGLTILRKPEISVEGRNFKTSHSQAVGGNFLDATPGKDGLTQQTFSSYSRRAELGFASIVYPNPDKHFAVAAYFSHPVAFSSTVGAGLGDPINFFLGPNGPVPRAQCAPAGSVTCQQFRIFPFGSIVSLDIKTLGVAGAYKMGKFSVGAAARYTKLSEDAETLRLDLNNRPLAGFAQLSDGNDTTFSVGVKWEPSSKFSAGASYKQGAKIRTKFLFGNLTAADTTPILIGNPDFHIPDTAGVGLSFRPIPALVVNVDAVSIKYSNLVDNFVSLFDENKANPHAFKAEDVVESRIGAEYFFTTKVPFAIRAGYWRDPAHQFFYNGATLTGNQVADKIIYQKGQDQNHKSVGVGIAFPAFQIDAAYDTSETYKVGSLSAVFRF